MDAVIYVNQLSELEQDRIRSILMSIGIKGEDLELALCSKLNDIDYLLEGHGWKQ